MRSLGHYCLALLLISRMTAFPARAEDSIPGDRLSSIVSSNSDPAKTLITGEPISGGNVVIRGEYLHSPYRVSMVGPRVFVNDVQIASLADEPRTIPTANDREFVARIERSLFWDSTLIVFDDQTRLVIDSSNADLFLHSMLKANSIAQQVQIIFEQADYDELAKNSIPTGQWRKALEAFSLTDSLVYCLEAGCLESSEDVCPEEYESPGDHDILVATSSLDSLMYVLNALGMLLAAVSLGVLITNPPQANVTWIETLRSPDAVRLVKRCLALIMVLSTFDLVSTLTAESTGSFTEANPLGAYLIDDFSLLTSVKLIGTCLTTALLWSQRRYVGVQLASWWICFVLTLVTIRWVVVDSLFYV